MRRLIAPLMLLVAMPAAIRAQEVKVLLETESDGSRTLSHEILIPAKRAKIWDAVATVAGWRSWAVPLARPVAGTNRFETSYDPSAAPGSANTIEQEWIERSSPKRVSFRTTRTPAGFPHAAAYMKVISRFTLIRDSGNLTRVRLSGVGYPAGGEGDALIRFFTAGNSAALRQLYKRFTSGPMEWRTPPQREPKSEQGD